MKLAQSRVLNELCVACDNDGVGLKFKITNGNRVTCEILGERMITYFPLDRNKNVEIESHEIECDVSITDAIKMANNTFSKLPLFKRRHLILVRLMHRINRLSGRENRDYCNQWVISILSDNGVTQDVIKTGIESITQLSDSEYFKIEGGLNAIAISLEYDLKNMTTKTHNQIIK